MTHNRMLDRAPSVVITSNRNELKLYQGNVVYLNDGDNFELRFFNPLQEKIGVEIMFNGIKKGESYLVLNPGQDVFLDRFLDEQRKMLFETYEINGNSQEAVEAIQQNGLITFNFYKEHYSSNYQNEVNVNYNFPPKPFKDNFNYTSSRSYTSSGSGSNGIWGSQGPAGPVGTPGTSSTGGFNTTNSNSRIYNSSTFTASCNSVTIGNTVFNTTSASYNPLETGMIEKGDISNQQLKTVNLQFNSTPFNSISYKIMPYSAMNRTVGEIRQYCTCCGYRLRKETWKFCPKCGTELQ